MEIKKKKDKKTKVEVNQRNKRRKKITVKRIYCVLNINYM